MKSCTADAIAIPMTHAQYCIYFLPVKSECKENIAVETSKCSFSSCSVFCLIHHLDIFQEAARNGLRRHLNLLTFLTMAVAVMTAFPCSMALVKLSFLSSRMGGCVGRGDDVEESPPPPPSSEPDLRRPFSSTSEDSLPSGGEPGAAVWEEWRTQDQGG